MCLLPMIGIASAYYADGYMGTGCVVAVSFKLSFMSITKRKPVKRAFHSSPGPGILKSKRRK